MMSIVESTIFINYRRSDTGSTAYRLFDDLSKAYGSERVFIDYERLDGGDVWPSRLEVEAQQASVMLVLIGDGWLRAQDPETFVRRLDQDGDWVRKEIETALSTGSLVVPILVEGAIAPKLQAFANIPSLVPLADRQALTLQGKTWTSDLKRMHELLALNGFAHLSRTSHGFGTTSRPFTIPTPVADFAGRDAELAHLEAALKRDGRAAICAVNGMGGVGKSQLAFELARRTAEDYPDGQVYLELRGTAADALSPAAALAELIRAMHPDAKTPVDLVDLKALYLQTWRKRRALILLDNAKDEVQVKDLVPPAPVAMLVTSRRQIVPDGGRMIRLDVLTEAQAVGLVRDILGTVRALTEEEARDLAQICGRLPLALRAAAKFLLRRSGWTTAEYLLELRSRGIAALDNVETVLGLSLDRLGEDDSKLRQRFMELGVFPAGFNVAAAAALWKTAHPAARDSMDILVDWGLAQVERAGRYRLHDLVRDLAVRRAEPTAIDTARSRHAKHYALVVSTANRNYLSGAADMQAALVIFDTERANIEAGHEWAAKNASTRDDAAVLLDRYSNGSASILDIRLTRREYIEWFNMALVACRRLGNQRGEAHSLGNLGAAWVGMGDAMQAIRHLEQCLAIGRMIRDRNIESKALGNLGYAWGELDNATKAIDYFQECLSIARDIGDRHSEAKMLGNIGAGWQNLKKLKEAIASYEQALDIARAIGDRRGEGQVLGNMGNVWLGFREPEKAIACQEQWLVISREIGDRLAEGTALWNLALNFERRGNQNLAIEYARGSLLIHQELEDPLAPVIESWISDRGADG